MPLPVFWSFRRCPYAMRARLALCVAEQQVELREILLRDKPQAFRAASPSATVPCLETGDEVIDESLDIMRWALAQNDPQGWLDMPEEGEALIQLCDGPFKTALDRYKYATRFPDHDPITERAMASAFLQDLEARLTESEALFGRTRTLADMAILPFVRQFAHVDLVWFQSQPWPNVISWLEGFKASELFGKAMHKFPVWDMQADPVAFPSIET
ncbi:glutathione S-transferase [Roseovarius rhodophyticola]|uniref:Glutathione S-transferase n=1 Tax=Roseovarius rhodophyticola TaxID=3080827 RepID=A0ABZ2TAT7_9RHOB|nr:glutathione S-transferase [Roseovarius sp. W115]MDV2930498.1 glutathione S-transferase [Roseovarius sp. W115]